MNPLTKDIRDVSLNKWMSSTAGDDDKNEEIIREIEMICAAVACARGKNWFFGLHNHFKCTPEKFRR